MLIPIVSFVLILRVWKTLDWEMNGSIWGLALLLLTIFTVRLRDQAVLVLVLSPQWSIYVPPHSLVVFAYATGVVLLFGGVRLFRAALFPIVLLWFVNPIPHVFNVLVDLPLQRASAHVARAFAIALGQPLSPDQLRLMFTPHFGMFIAPGCNGIRGAVTMGFIALIAGYLYRFRWLAHTFVVVAAVLLGYVFNFVRLCILVLYYIVALHIPWLQKRAEMGDYIIGGCLFLLATFLLFYVVGRRKQSQNETKPSPAPIPTNSFPPPQTPTQARSIYLRLAAMAVIALVGSIGVAYAFQLSHSPEALAAAARDHGSLNNFPDRIGNYSLVRTWNENLNAATLLFHWAEYAPNGDGPHVSIGISPILGSHDTLICHSARGEDPLWLGQLALPTADGTVTFSGSFFNDSATQFLEATTICNGAVCGEYSNARTRFGLVYSRPAPQALFSQDPARPIPILIRAETIDTTLPANTARLQMSAAISSFVASVNLSELTWPYRRP
jgi:exosortase J